MSQTLGPPVPHTEPVPLTRIPMRGVMVELREPDPRTDAAALYPSTHGSTVGEAVWTYMGYGPFPDPGAMADWIANAVRSPDPLWYTVTSAGRPAGMVAMMNAVPEHRRLELGHIWYVPEMHRTGVNTETVYLMLREAFTTFNTRRVEWKCDNLNETSRHAALRVGFRYEGTFRNHMMVKGRNRDTAWYAMTDDEWPAARERLETWLAHPDPKPSLGVSPA
ncbi:MAG: GNAT family N-acetyltransferase [Actinobacteria bacterium]|nr:GNAT family N-acetyltransferase [Actinomycetota bacterium]